MGTIAPMAILILGCLLILTSAEVVEPSLDKESKGKKPGVLFVYRPIVLKALSGQCAASLGKQHTAHPPASRVNLKPAP